MKSDDKTVPVKIWDLPTRIFHWSQLCLVAACWWNSTSGGDMDAHMLCGYAVLSLLLFRMCWGVVGSSSALFSGFISSPRAVLKYFSSLRSETTSPHPGHNPAGGWMVLALLGMLSLISLTGLFANDDMMSEGPLAKHVTGHWSDLATALHAHGFNILLALVTLHLGAIGFYLLAKKENLVRPMLTGIKYLPHDTCAPIIRSNWLACLLALCVAGMVWVLLKFA